MKRLTKYLGVFLAGLILASSMVAVMPQREAKAAIPIYVSTGNATVYPYGKFATAGAGNFGVPPSSSREILPIGHIYRVRETGNITSIRIYTADKTSIQGVYIKVWRVNAWGNYDLVGTSDNIVGGMVAGSTTNITLLSPITGVQEGDYVGIRLEAIAGSGTNSQLHKLDGESNVTSYSWLSGTNNSPSSSNFSWSTTNASVGQVVPIEMFMSSPIFVGIGDSMISGRPQSSAFLVDNPPGTPFTANTTILQHISDLSGYNFQNMGVSGQKVNQINTRFNTDLIALNPRVAIIEGSINDISGGTTEVSFLSSWTSMLGAAQNSTTIQKIIVLKIFPWSSGTNVQMQTRDIWNRDLAGLSANYSKAVVIDSSQYVGQFRVGGDAGNLWDIQAAYNVDGTHFNSAGYAQVANAILDSYAEPSISNITSNLTVDKDGIVSGNFSENVTSMDGATSLNYWWEYGATSSYGSTTANTTTNTSGIKTITIPAGVTQGYHYRFNISPTSTSNTTHGSDSTFTLTLPSVTTGTPTNVGSTATLNGNISSMGVASSTYAYFIWSQSGVSHTTALQTKSATGAVTDTITFDPNKELNVMAVTKVGTVYSYGSWVTLSPIQGNTFFKTFIPILFGVVVAFVILSIVFSVGITIQGLALVGIGGTLAYYVVSAIVNLLF